MGRSAKKINVRGQSRKKISLMKVMKIHSVNNSKRKKYKNSSSTRKSKAPPFPLNLKIKI